jgi:hypothetical protein
MSIGRIPVCCFAFLLGCAPAYSQQRIEVRVDPRIELLSVTQILADYGSTGLLANQRSAYRRDVDEWFAPFREHPAVKRLAELFKAGYSYDAPLLTMICLSKPPELELSVRPDECGAQRAGGAESLAAWLEQLRDLARVSDFNQFFRAHAGFYRLMEEQTRQKILKDYAADLEDYHGIRHASYTIILAPLASGNYGPRRRRPDGRLEIYGVLGSGRMTDGVPQFGTVQSLRRLVWHEFGHSFSNPEVDALRAQVARNSKLFQPIASRMEASAYGEWHTAVIEHVNRAVEVRLAFRELGDDSGVRELDFEKAQGFAYVEALAERLKEYEQNRAQYPTFRDFAPQLIGVFDQLSSRKLPPDFYDVPPTVQWSMGDRRIFVVPTGETDTGAQQKILGYVTMVRDRFAKEAEIITDEEALARDLSTYNVQAYGTLTGNKWLAKHRDAIPAVAALSTMRESGPLQLIAVLPDAGSTRVLAVAYTATEAGAVPGINSLSPGPVAYAIGKNMNVLRSGYYRRQDGRWTIKQ